MPNILTVNYNPMYFKLGPCSGVKLWLGLERDGKILADTRGLRQMDSHTVRNDGLRWSLCVLNSLVVRDSTPQL